ncbi:hypothetical protein DYB38_000041 [Aphanomyces astaci]|uniref:Peptidase M16 C-terminal domain-containing protein n=1 Tax=Aphanomyces astaci TaxID=112090 RepID=A0A397DL92_APHAT|nr:hypothetical protein DYB38_000041 [Aphanomyces astaci]
MKLVVYGKEDLNILEDWVTTLFSPVVNKGVQPLVQDGHHPYEPPQQNREIHVVPVKDLRMLELSFPLPTVQDQYLSKPHRILSYVLGYEGRGSLLAYFKAMGYANSLSAGISKDFADWSLFSVKINLTHEGVANYRAMAQAVFHYIDLVMAAPPDALATYFHEAQALATLGFRFRNQEQPIHYVSWLTSNMQKYPVHHVVAGPSLLHEHDDAEVRQLLALLHPSRVRLTLVSKSLTPDATEPWLHAAYSDSPLSSSASPFSMESPAIDMAELHLPPLINPFIPTSFDLLPSSDPSTHDMHVLRDDHRGRVWFKPGNSFGKPKASVRLKIYHSVAYASPLHAVLTELFVSCIRDKVAQDLYDADVAGTSVGLSSAPTGVTLHVDGYSDTLPLVVAKVAAIVASPVDMEASFARLKDKLVRGYANAALDEPHVHAAALRTWVLTTPVWTTPEKLDAATDDVTWQHLVQHATVLFQDGFKEAFVYGNVDKVTCDDFADMYQYLDVDRAVVGRPDDIIDGTRNDGAIDGDEGAPLMPSPRRNVRLDGNYVVRERNPNPSNPNAAVLVLFQLGQDSTSLRATSVLLAHLVKVPCFSTLRTTEQLGYLVSSGQYIANNVIYLSMSVQSNKYSPLHLQSRLDAFCDSFRVHLQTLSGDLFQQHQAAVVAQLMEAPKTYEEESARLWHEIAGETYEFDRREQVAAVVPTVTLADVVDVVDTKLAGVATRHRLCVQIFAPTDDMHMDGEEEGATVIVDRAEFKRHLGLFPARTRISAGAIPLAKL